MSPHPVVLGNTHAVKDEDVGGEQDDRRTYGNEVADTVCNGRGGGCTEIVGLTNRRDNEVSEYRGIILVEETVTCDRLGPVVDEVQNKGPHEEHDGEHDGCGVVTPTESIDWNWYVLVLGHVALQPWKNLYVGILMRYLINVESANTVTQWQTPDER